MKCCFGFKSVFGTHCSITCGDCGWCYVASPGRYDILGCLPSVLIYLGKDISRFQLFPLINTALGGLLPRCLPSLKTSCQGEECTRSVPNIEFWTFPPLFSISDFKSRGIFRTFLEERMMLFLLKEVIWKVSSDSPD